MSATTRNKIIFFSRLTSTIFRSYKIKRFITSTMERKEYFNAKNWALLDIEYIQCTRTHQCIRKLYILAKNGYTDLQLECIPCKPLHKLEKRYQKAFHFCQSEIHKLPYCPEGSSLPCSAAVERLNNFIKNNEIDLVFYKGGDIEKKVCDKLHINSFNIENFMNELEKVYSHDPYIEVNCYFTQLVEFLL